MRNVWRFCFGVTFRNFCDCFEYEKFSIISAPFVRELLMCVAFGGPHFGFSLAIREQVAIEEIGGVSHGSGCRALPHNFLIGRCLAAH